MSRTIFCETSPATSVNEHQRLWLGALLLMEMVRSKTHSSRYPLHRNAIDYALDAPHEMPAGGCAQGEDWDEESREQMFYAVQMTIRRER